MSRRLVPLVVLVALAACAVPGLSAEPRPRELEEPVRAAAVPEDAAVEGFRATLSRHSRATRDQSINIGTAYQFDRLLVSRSVYKSSSWMRVNKEYVTVTGTGPIHRIQIEDLLKNGENAEVKIKKGGIGQSEVALRFKSKRGGKINYQVNIWG